jgi:catechol 2,3-dioxygenase
MTMVPDTDFLLRAGGTILRTPDPPETGPAPALPCRAPARAGCTQEPSPMSASPAPQHATLAPLHIGGITLAVRELEGMAAFYTELLDLRPLPGAAPGEVLLGAGGTPLLRLRHAPGAQPETGHEPGLFHTAFLLPSEAALGAWLRQANALGLRLQGASDHGVSAAIYLDDPEGNGIEVYADRDPALWPRPEGRPAEIAMFTRPLDLQALAALPAPAPGHSAGTRIGHVHLRVGEVRKAESFYRALGLAVMQHGPQVSFLSSGGYHHHLAVNSWRSQGAETRPQGLSGLREVVMVAAGRAAFDQAAAALRAGGAVTAGEGCVAGQDASGISLRLMLGG